MAYLYWLPEVLLGNARAPEVIDDLLVHAHLVLVGLVVGSQPVACAH